MNFVFYDIHYFYAKTYLINLDNSSKYIRINTKEVLVNSKYLKICL